MDLEAVQKAYSRWAKFYDLVFGPAFVSARRRAIAMLELESGQRVLEVGVGTGLSFPHFPSDVRVVGVDVSLPMLRKARPRAAESGSWLAMGDVARLPFRDDAFDAIFAPYVVSAVPDPEAMMLEIARVGRESARVVLVNHFVSGNPVLARIERAISPTTSRIAGFHADFDLEPVLERTGFKVEAGRRVPPLRYWKALRLVEDAP